VGFPGIAVKDENAIVLDFLHKGTITMRRSEPVAQVLGNKYFSLLEVIIKPGLSLKPGQIIYIGDGKREEVQYIKGRVNYADLTVHAKDQLEVVIKELVKSNEQRIVEFFNKADSITTRLHSLELIPGIGKKHMWDIIDARREKPFVSLQDIHERVKLLPNPEEMVVKRIMMELRGEDRYKLFTAGMPASPHSDRR
jgi:putative nucleotide binding protein